MPDRYAILFEVDAPVLRTFGESGSRIVIAKHGSEGSGNVAWLAWAPSGSDTVTWDETYGLFAAEAALRDGGVLRISSALESVLDRSIYPFSGSGFGAPERTSHIPARHYDVRNESATAMAFGLLQSAAVNGAVRRSALNAAVVPASFTADFAALTTLSIWVQPNAESGSIVRVPPDATVLSLAGEPRTLRCKYDPRAARFVPS
jgi:hypothetical protein